MLLLTATFWPIAFHGSVAHVCTRTLPTLSVGPSKTAVGGAGECGGVSACTRLAPASNCALSCWLWARLALAHSLSRSTEPAFRERRLRRSSWTHGVAAAGPAGSLHVVLPRAPIPDALGGRGGGARPLIANGIASRPASRAPRRLPDQKETTREEEPSRQQSRHQMAHRRDPEARHAAEGCSASVMF